MNLKKFEEEKQLIEDISYQAEQEILEAYNIDKSIYNDYDLFVDTYGEALRDEINDEIFILIKEKKKEYEFEYI